MSTSTATPAPTSLIRGAVLVSFFDGGHQTHTAFAHVLAVGPADENGNPSLTVAFPDPAASDQQLASVKWHEGYKRLPGVLHVSHPDVQAGKVSIGWGGAIATTDELKGSGPQIPQPAGDATRPYLKREVPSEALHVSPEQALAAQAGKTSPSSTQSPLINEPEASQIATPANLPTATQAPAADPAAETPGLAPDAGSVSQSAS